MTWDSREIPPLFSLGPEPSAYPEIPICGQDVCTHSQVGKLGQRGCEWGPTPGSLSAGGVCPPQLSRPITAVLISLNFCRAVSLSLIISNMWSCLECRSLAK